MIIVRELREDWKKDSGKEKEYGLDDGRLLFGKVWMIWEGTLSAWPGKGIWLSKFRQ